MYLSFDNCRSILATLQKVNYCYSVLHALSPVSFTVSWSSSWIESFPELRPFKIRVKNKSLILNDDLSYEKDKIYRDTDCCHFEETRSWDQNQ